MEEEEEEEEGEEEEEEEEEDRAHAHTELRSCVKEELCESGGGRPGLPVPNSPYGTLNSNSSDALVAAEPLKLCEQEGGARLT